MATIRSHVWMYFLVPVLVLALFMDADQWRQPKMVLLGYISSFITSTSIALPLELLYGLIGPRWFRASAWGWREGLGHVAIWLVGTTIGVEITIRVQVWIGFWRSHAGSWNSLFPAAYVVSGTIILMLVVTTRLQARQRESEVRAVAARQQALRAQLEALRARTNPHFLFNSLNSVAALIDGDPAGAEGAVERLSRMLRYSLEGSRREEVRLGEEIEMVRDYLRIEELRFGDRLRARLSLDPSLESASVPPLVLQPLVENAVLHGIAGMREGGDVWVEARGDGDRLVLSVENSVPATGPVPSNGSGGSLRELRERLSLVYGAAAGLTYGFEGKDRFVVRIELPWNVGSPPPPVSRRPEAPMSEGSR